MLRFKRSQPKTSHAELFVDILSPKSQGASVCGPKDISTHIDHLNLSW